ncbi:hypothetical protein LTR70_007936 [Exophiala xenobiotica]|nr:hypothetical protein LTR70_007936 [Exophiala xenobiotica]
MLRNLLSPSSLPAKSKKTTSDKNVKLKAHSLSELQRSSDSWLSLSKSFEKQRSGNCEKTMLTFNNVSETRSRTYEDVETLLLGRLSETMKPESLHNCPSTGPPAESLVAEERAPSPTGGANSRVNFELTRVVRGRAMSEPILTTTIGERITCDDMLESLPLRLLDLKAKQVSIKTASTQTPPNGSSVADSSSQTTVDSRSDAQAESPWESKPNDRTSRIAWAHAPDTQSSVKHSYVRTRPAPTTKLYSPPPREISWSANTYESVFEDSSDEEDVLDSFDSFDSFFHVDQTRPLWPLASASAEPKVDPVKTKGIIIPAQTSCDPKHQGIRDGNANGKPEDLPLFLETQDATPNYFGNFWHRPVQHWAEPHPSPEITTEHIYPLSHTNIDPSFHGPRRAHPECQHNNAYRITPLAPTWHITCPLDNIHHSHSDPTTLYNGKTCANPQSNPKCWICWTELGYSGPQTLTHAIPYFDNDEDEDQRGGERVFISCGQSFHLDCAASYVKATGAFAPCPACGERWHVGVEFGVGEWAGRAEVGKVFGFELRREEYWWTDE